MSDIKHNLISSFDTVGAIRKATRRIDELLSSEDSNKNIQNLDAESLDEMIYLSERIALSARKNFELADKNGFDSENFGAVISKESLENPSRNDRYEANILKKNYPISVTFQDGKLIVRTPLTFKRFYKNRSLKENYLIMIYIRAALIKWQKQSGFDLFQSINAPIILTIKRKVLKWNPSEICDNDNLENGRIGNEIINSLGYSDNAMAMSVFSCVEVVTSQEECGMEFIVCSKADFRP